MSDASLSTYPLAEGPETFDVTVLRPIHPLRTVLFAAGSGGNPLRHLPLLQSLAERGCTVAAPHFERLTSSIPTKEDFLSRAHRLDRTVASFAEPNLPLVGIGHSFGAAMLLALAGAEARTLAGDRVSLPSKMDFDRLLLLAPPTGFFRAPGALDSVDAAVVVWAGVQDTITPPEQATFLRDALQARGRVEARLVEDAGHFTFMNELPPGVVDPHPDRVTFLADLADQVHRAAAP